MHSSVVPIFSEGRHTFILSNQNQNLTFHIALMRATYTTHPILLPIPTLRFGEQSKLWQYTSRIFLQPLVTSYLLGPDMFLSTLSSNTLSQFYSLDVRDQVLLS